MKITMIGDNKVGKTRIEMSFDSSNFLEPIPSVFDNDTECINSTTLNYVNFEEKKSKKTHYVPFDEKKTKVEREKELQCCNS